MKMYPSDLPQSKMNRSFPKRQLQSFGSDYYSDSTEQNGYINEVVRHWHIKQSPIVDRRGHDDDISAVQSDSERRQYDQLLILKLQEERQQVWSLFCKVDEQKPFSFIEKTQLLLTQFSQLLIDYVASGDFFEPLLSETERKNTALKTAKVIYPKFLKTTKTIISFNDKYDDKPISNTNKLGADLSFLGETLAKRMKLEDKLCQLALK